FRSNLLISLPPRHPHSPLSPYTTLFRSMMDKAAQDFHTLTADLEHVKYTAVVKDTSTETGHIFVRRDEKMRIDVTKPDPRTKMRSEETRLNSSHVAISYAVFCLKKKKKT